MHIIIPVDQEVPKRLGVAPRDRRVPGLHSGIRSIASLADDLQLPNHRTLFSSFSANISQRSMRWQASRMWMRYRSAWCCDVDDHLPLENVLGNQGMQGIGRDKIHSLMEEVFQGELHIEKIEEP